MPLRGVVCALAVLLHVTWAFAEQPVVRVEVTGVPKWEQEEVRARVEPLRARGWSEGDEVDWRNWILAAGTYRDVAVRANRSGDGVIVSVTLLRKLRVGTVRFEGHETLSSARLRRAFRVFEGQPFDEGLLEAGRQRLLKLYRDEGFPEATVEILRDPSEEFIDLTLLIRERDADRISAIRWQGVDGTQSPQLERAARLKLGARWMPRRRHQVRRAIESALRSEKYLSSKASVTWERVTAGRVVVSISVDLGPKYEVFFQGNKEISEQKLRSLVEQKRGRVVGLGVWDEITDRVRTEYQKRGFFAADVAYSVEADTAQLRKVNFRIREGPKFQVCSLQFIGNELVRARDLRRQMRASRSRWWRRWIITDESLRHDFEAIEMWYRRQGFLEAKVTDRQIVLDWARGCLDLVVVVSEGHRTRIGEARMEGFPYDATSLRLRSIRPGDPLDPDRLEDERRQLEQGLRKLGYLEGRVELRWEVSVQGSHHLARVHFHAFAGPRYELGSVMVEGNFDTRSSVIIREAGLQPGRTIDPDQLTRAQLRVQQLGIFRGVDVSLLQDSPELVDISRESHQARPDVAQRAVKIVVDERPPIQLNAGGGFNTRDGFRAFFEMGHANLAHRAAQLSLRADVALDPAEAAAPNNYLSDLSLRVPQLAGLNWALRSSLSAQRSTRSVDQFSIERVAARAAAERRVDVKLLAGMELEAERARVFDVQPDVRNFNPRDEGRLSSWGFGPFLLYDGRDDPFMPTRGVSESLRARIVPSLLGVDIPLVKLQWLHSHYVPLWWGVGAVYAFRVGWARTLTGEVVPLRERFFTGGRASVRGFSENSIGPKGAPVLDATGQVRFAGGNPLGGDLLLNSNLELHFPLILDAEGVVFLDGGGVYFQDRSVTWKGYRRSAGLGLVYRTPLGPLALHYGFKLDRRSGEDVGAVHFSVGVPF